MDLLGLTRRHGDFLIDSPGSLCGYPCDLRHFLVPWWQSQKKKLEKLHLQKEEYHYGDTAHAFELTGFDVTKWSN